MVKQFYLTPEQLNQPLGCKMAAKNAAEVLQLVRYLMKKNGPIHAYIIPWADAHNSEYLADCDTQRAIISGFTGSAGTAIVTQLHACLWTDGRYYLQAAKEMDTNWTLMKESLPDTPTQAAWLNSNIPRGSKVAIDPFLISHNNWKTLHEQLEAAGNSLISVPGGRGLVEQVWDNRPPRPANPVKMLDIKFTGQSTMEKLTAVRQTMAKNKAAGLVLNGLDEVAWLLNLRGSDIPYNPVFFAYVLVMIEQLHIFVEEARVPPEVEAYLISGAVGAIIHPYEDALDFIGTLQPLVNNYNTKVWFGTSANRALTLTIPERSHLIQPNPVTLMKAIKNSVEAEGMRQAHIRDGAAVCQYFAWLENALKSGEKVTEASGARILEKFRSEMEHFQGPSFSTISSVGANGAIIHYHPSKEGSETDLQITTDTLYLCDSGAQYLDGTTDITRTVHFGSPTDYQRECFTRVLKGQIQLGNAVFPEKIRGNCLDTLARKYLWDVGLDYQHGTGHGIGSYLCVHEGPMGMSWRTYPDDPGLQAGMFLSNEPGYYEQGSFGIRLENIVHIVPSTIAPNFLAFETVTLVPIQTKMIVRDMLTSKEVETLNGYHRTCRDKLIPILEKGGHSEVIEWLRKETEPI